MMNKAVFAALLAALVSACDYAGGRAQSGQRTDAAYRAAMEDYRAGRLDQAIAGFRKVCRDDPSNSSARFQLACLLLDASRDHAGAYCAFREYLLQQPGSDKERLARDRLAACEKEFARELAAKHGLADSGAEASAAIASLKEKLAASEKEREAQRNELAEAKKSIAALSAQVKHLKSLVSDSPDAEAPSRDVRDVKALLAGEDDAASVPTPNAGRDVLAEDDPDLAAVAPIAQPKDAKKQRDAAKEEAEVLYRAGRPVLRWAGAERALALWMQGTAQTLTFRREDGSFAVKRPMCTIAAEDGELVFQLEGRLEEPKKTSVLSQAQVEQWLQTVAEEVLEQTQAAGADWFCIQGQLRQRTGNEKGRTRVQVRLVAD